MKQVQLNTKNIGKNLKKIRTFIGLSITELSRRTGLTPAAICQIENNKREPELKSVIKLMNCFNISFERLLK